MSARSTTKRAFESRDSLLEELRVLKFLTAEEAGQFDYASCERETASECAARLVKLGVLTAYQSERILAGRGKRLFFGPYLLQQLLGRGGMGRVFLAEHRLMRRRVALKVFGTRDRRRICRRFRREVEALARLRHPNVVTAYDAGIAREQLYLAMEYVEGVDLQRFVRRNGPLSPDLTCEIVRQAALALEHAHRHGLVHRDLKPSNLMIAPPGVTVKLLDLGLAEWKKTTSPLRGTVDFMAPELGDSERPLDVRSDLYSLGCTFYFLLTGRVPFPGGSGAEKLLRHSLDEPTPLETLRPDVSPRIGCIVRRLMARDVNQRYESGSVVVRDLTTDKDCDSGITRNAPHQTRKLIRFAFSALAFSLLGMATGRGMRHAMPLPAVIPLRTTIPAMEPFAISGRDAGFASLQDAIENASDGDVIVVRESNAYALPCLDLQKKTLTIRTADGVQARFVGNPSENPWQALLQTDTALTLEGVELSWSETRPVQTPPLIRFTEGALRLRNCRLSGGRGSALLVARRPTGLLVEKCQLITETTGLSVEVGESPASEICFKESQISVREPSGTAFSLWSEESAVTSSLRMVLEDCSIESGFTFSLQEQTTRAAILARHNRFTYRTALLRYSRDSKIDTIWQGSDNSYSGPSAWLNVGERAVEQPSLPDDFFRRK